MSQQKARADSQTIHPTRLSAAERMAALFAFRSHTVTEKTCSILPLLLLVLSPDMWSEVLPHIALTTKSPATQVTLLTSQQNPIHAKSPATQVTLLTSQQNPIHAKSPATQVTLLTSQQNPIHAKSPATQVTLLTSQQNPIQATKTCTRPTFRAAYTKASNCP